MTALLIHRCVYRYEAGTWVKVSMRPVYRPCLPRTRTFETRQGTMYLVRYA